MGSGECRRGWEFEEKNVGWWRVEKMDVEVAWVRRLRKVR